MSIYLDKEVLPLGRNVDVFVYNRDINHENESNQAERLLSLSSTRTYKLLDDFKIKMVSKTEHAKFDRRVILTNVKDINHDILIKYYERLLKFQMKVKSKSIELPFIGYSEEELNIVLKYLEEFSGKNDISINLYSLDRKLTELL